MGRNASLEVGAETSELGWTWWKRAEKKQGQWLVPDLIREWMTKVPCVPSRNVKLGGVKVPPRSSPRCLFRFTQTSTLKSFV